MFRRHEARACLRIGILVLVCESLTQLTSYNLQMASPFSMLSMISRSRRAPPTAPPNASPNVTRVKDSDTASISSLSKSGFLRSKKGKPDSDTASISSLSKPKLLRGKIAKAVEARVSIDTLGDKPNATPSNTTTINNDSKEPTYAPVLQPGSTITPEPEWTEVESSDSGKGKENTKEAQVVLALDDQGEIEDTQRRDTVEVSPSSKPDIDYEALLALEKERVAATQGELTALREELVAAQNRITGFVTEKAEVARTIGEKDEMIRLSEREKIAKENEVERLQSQTLDTMEELRRMRGELNSTGRAQRLQEEKVQDLEREKAQLARDLYRAREDLTNAQEEAVKGQARMGDLEKRSGDLEIQMRQDLLRLHRELDQEVEERKSKEEQAAVVQIRMNELTDEVDRLNEQLKTTVRQNQMLEDQLRRQSAEAYTRQGSHSPIRRALPNGRLARNKENIVSLMKTLNEEIFQTAAFMADTLDVDGRARPMADANGDVSTLISKMSGIIGRRLILIVRFRLSQATSEFNPLPIQVAFQACMIYCCQRIIKSWYPGHWEYGDILATLFSRIQGTGESNDEQIYKADSSASESRENVELWRTITRGQCEHSTETQEQMVAFLGNSLADVLTAVGWTRQTSEAQRLIDMFRSKISQVARLALQINAAIGTGNADISGGLEPMLVEPDEIFDIDLMENAYREDDDDTSEAQSELNWSSERVMCTTDMGLRRIPSQFDVPRLNTTQWVLKPKVVLRSILEQGW